jgi:hypothetical protein
MTAKAKTKTKPRAKAKAAPVSSSPTPNKSTPTLPDAVIIEQLQKSHGNVSHAAAALGLTRTSLSDRIGRTPELKQVCDDARESIVDAAENALYRAVVKGEAWAVCFTLKTQGKARGYVEKQEVDNSGEVTMRVIYGDDGSSAKAN